MKYPTYENIEYILFGCCIGINIKPCNQNYEFKNAGHILNNLIKYINQDIE